jgi:hypothetical protein
MEDKIIQYLIDSGKITKEDIKEAKEAIPTRIELDLLRELHDCYCPLSHAHSIDIEKLECDYYLNDKGIAMQKYLALLPLLRDHCARIAVETTNVLIPDSSDKYVLQQES